MVQATVHEPFDLLAAFVAHYLELGADLIHLHFDTPHPEAEAAFRGHPKIQMTLCDTAYWARMKPAGRPLAHPKRQRVNARKTFAKLKYDWLFLCDADEYLVPRHDMATMLAAQPAHLDFLRVSMAEKVLPPGLTPDTVFEGVFRLPHPAGQTYAETIYGPQLATVLERVVAGHDLGKSILRRGGDFGINVHWPVARLPKAGSAASPVEPVGAWLPDACLAHYDALTPLYYLVKLLGKHLSDQAIIDTGQIPRLLHRSRVAQIEMAVAACAEHDAVAKTAPLHHLTPQSMQALRNLGLLLELDLAPDRIARKHFPHLNLDFSPATFDRALRIKHATTLAKMGLA